MAAKRFHVTSGSKARLFNNLKYVEESKVGTFVVNDKNRTTGSSPGVVTWKATSISSSDMRSTVTFVLNLRKISTEEAIHRLNLQLKGKKKSILSSGRE